MYKTITFILIILSSTVFCLPHKIALDPASQTGTSYGEITAGDINLGFILKLRDYLNDDTYDTNGGGSWDLTVVRETEDYVSLSSRIEAANAADCEYYVTVWTNSFDGSETPGTETYSKNQTPDTTLRDLIHEKAVELLGLGDRGVKIFTSGHESLYSDANMPVIIFYPGFISNSTDRPVIASEIGQDNGAKGIFYALQLHYGYQQYDPTGNDDFNPPIISINSHSNNQVVETEIITITGVVTDTQSDISSITVNETEATYNTSNSTFSAQVTLQPGSNLITVVATDQPGNEAQETLTIIYEEPDTTGPVISVDSPYYYGITVEENSYNLTGTVIDSENLVTLFKIDNTTVTLNGMGEFEYNLNLIEGDNSFTLYAEDSEGNDTTVTVMINYEPSQGEDTTPPSIYISSPENNSTTNESQITIVGTVSDQSEISTFTVNGESSLLENGSFSHIIDLTEGNNIIEIYAKDQYNNETTEILNITYNPQATDITGPVISITEPLTGTRYSDPEVDIIGTVTDSSGVQSLTIDGENVTIAGDGSFTYTITLSEIGPNDISIISTDNLGNSSTKQLRLYLENHQNSGPQIVLYYPQTNITVDEKLLTVEGRVSDSDGVQYLTINTMNVSLTGDEFSFTLPLNEGENQIVVEASDNEGNISRLTVVITYTPKTTSGGSSDDGGCSFSAQNGNTISILSLLFIFSIILIRRKNSLN